MEGVCVKCTGVFDETYATLSAFPIIGYYYKRIHNWYHEKTNHKCHQPGCSETHAEHTVKVKEVLVPNPSEWNVMTMEEVDAHYGQNATILLMFDRKLLGVKDFLPHSAFTWLFTLDDTLSARYGNKFFAWDGERWARQFEETPKPEYEPGSLDQAAKVIRMLMANEENAAVEAEKFLDTI